MEKYETHEHDVLIIGAGGAGLRAAIEALSGHFLEGRMIEFGSEMNALYAVLCLNKFGGGNGI